MRPSRLLPLALAGMLAALPARAVTFDMTLIAQGIGNDLPVAGISGLPAGPFFGSFSHDGPLTPDQELLSVAFTDFDLTIGTESWSLDDVITAVFDTDAGGNIDPSRFSLAAFNGSASLEIQFGIFVNLGWHVLEAGGSCLFATQPPFVGPLGGNCIGGGPDAIHVVQRREAAAVPAPAPAGLLVLALLGLLGWRFRTAAAA